MREMANTPQRFEIETLNMRKAALVFRAINHNLRQQVLTILHRNIRMDVTTLYKKLGVEQSVASQHLAILRKAGFVNTKREGQQIFYSVNYIRLEEVTKQAKILNEIQ
jgi:DNA-binding transcriptional ArsR family regulator